MKLRHKEVQHIARLARLGLSEAEVEKFSIQLSDILENFEILQQVDTDKVAPATRSVLLHDVFREDRIAESLPQSKILSNAPSQEEYCFKVQAILE